MAINLKAPEKTELRPRITVLGVGGAGGNAVNNMISSRLEGVDFVVANTDAQALAQSKAERKIQLGAKATEGLGAGAQPDVGRAGAEESLDEILEQVAGSHMVFITAGMGGGTGTGAAPVIARAVREAGILTVGVVTKPFAFEGDKRMRAAERGIAELQAYVHTLIVIPNQNLFRVANDRTTFAQAFAMADEVLHAGVRGVTDLILMPGLINLDFADIKSVISEMGKAMMGTGEAEGEDRAQKAADLAISNPLLDDVTMKGAKGVLINITGGPDLMLFEVEQAANRIRAEVDPDANIIFGNTILDDMEGRIRVSVVATGIDAEMLAAPKDKVQPLRPYLKPMVKDAPRPAAASYGSPVHRQVETLASEMNAVPGDRGHALREDAVTSEETEAFILGGVDAPVVGEDDIPPMPAAYAAMASRPAQPAETMRPAPEAPVKKRFGLFGRAKAEAPRETRIEPVVQTRVASASRALAQPMGAQPMARPETVSRPAQPVIDPAQGLNPSRDDLFAEQGKDDSFDIPAFLRRQSN